MASSPPSSDEEHEKSYFQISACCLPGDEFLSIDDYPYDESSFLCFEKKLDRYRALAPDPEAPPQFSILSRWKLPLVDFSRESQERHRPFPLVARHSAFMDPSSLRFSLYIPLHVGEEKWAQVWRANVTLAGHPTVPSALVVIKIFQESLSYLEREDFESECWPSGAYLARSEAWAYSQMTSIQGESRRALSAP